MLYTVSRFIRMRVSLVPNPRAPPGEGGVWGRDYMRVFRGVKKNGRLIM